MAIMSSASSPSDLTGFLANEHIKAVFSRGAAAEEQINRWLRLIVSGQRQVDLQAAIQDFELLKRHTSDDVPEKSGIYLKLLHGRAPYNQELDDWGSDGPWIGPIKWFHCTYLRTFSLGFTDGEEFLSTFPSNVIPTPIYFFEEMIYYDGVYYGDWEIQAI